jgi:predicted small lipoprotein YifL
MNGRMKTAVALLAALCPAACGQKGPLYLPERTGEVITRPTQEPEPATPQTPKPEKPTESETADPPR